MGEEKHVCEGCGQVSVLNALGRCTTCAALGEGFTKRWGRPSDDDGVVVTPRQLTERLRSDFD